MQCRLVAYIQTTIIRIRQEKPDEKKSSPGSRCPGKNNHNNNMDSNQYQQLKQYLHNGKIPKDKTLVKPLIAKSKFFELRNNQLYKKDR